MFTAWDKVIFRILKEVLWLQNESFRWEPRKKEGRPAWRLLSRSRSKNDKCLDEDSGNEGKQSNEYQEVESKKDLVNRVVCEWGENLW